MGSKSEAGGEGKKKRRKDDPGSGSKRGDGGKKKARGEEQGAGEAPSSAVGGERTRVSVRVERERDGTTGTVLACFSDAPPPLEHLSSAGGISLACEAQASSRKRVLTGETKSLVFEGTSGSGSAAAFKYMVGLYDPDKCEVVVADPGPLAAGNVVSLRRRVKSVGGGGSLGELTREQARDALVDGFGSKRVRTVHRQRKGQELEKEGGEALGRLEKELLVKKEESAIARAAIGAGGGDDGPSDLAPKCNLQARTPEEAYALRDVVNDDEWDSLAPGQILDLAKDPAGEGAKMLPPFVRAQLPALLACEDKKDRRRRAKLLMYCAFLLLYNGLPSRFNKNAQALRDELGMPFAVAQRMLSSYAEQADRGFAKPQACRDKLLLALCVVTLMLGNFEVTFGQLAGDLKLHPDKLSTYFREVGASVVKPKGQAQTDYTARLTAPLTFPRRSKGPMKW